MGKTRTNSEPSGDTPRPSTSSADLHLEIAGSSRRAGLAAAIRDAVRTGRLASGTRLPASRALAADLGIARSTVTQAYGELVAEGWLTARQGSGTQVAARTATADNRAHARQATRPSAPRHGLSPGSTEYGEFPRGPWLTAARRAITLAPNSAFGYGDLRGREELRKALSAYLARTRGVSTNDDNIVICAGFHHGLALMARVLIGRGVRTVAVESFGLDIHRHVLADAGLEVEAIGVDGGGACIDDLHKLRDVGAVLLTPAHQFPTGVVLASERRSAAIDWARASGAFVLEDDYDGEFRYDRQPVGALQGLDPERVVYFGTASKSVAPGLRLGWMALPEELVPQVVAAKGYAELASTLEQLTFAEFINSGAFDRHVRSMRQRYRRRRDQLVSTLARTAPHARATGIAAGLQAVIEVPPGAEAPILETAASQGLDVSGLAEFRYVMDGTSETADALVVNYAAPSESAWPSALDSLARVLSMEGAANPVVH